SLAAAKGTADRTFEADLTKGLGDACAAAGHDEEALRCYSKACANARKRHERAKEAQYLTATGELYLARRDYGRAEVFLEEAAGIACTDGLWQERVEALHSLARARTGLGDYSGSQKLLEESISALERGLADKRFFENRQPLNERVRAIFADLLVLESARGPQCDSLLFTAEKARQFRAGAKGIRHKDLDASIKLCLARRDWIPEGALIIQCVVTPERLIIAGMDRLRMECRSISVSVDSLNRDVDSFVAACGTATHASTHAESPGAGGDIEMRARSLYRLLVEPLGSLVSGKETLCFICDEPLHRVPFGALVRPGGGAHFLLEDTRVVSSPDLLTLYAAAQKGRSPESGTHPAFTLLVGRPDIGSCLTRNYPGLETLPNAQDELFEIRDAIGRATILAGPLATKEAVVQRMPSADRIHIATHRVSYPAYSGRGALLFSAADECDVAHAVETSLLTESEIGGLDLSKVDLVVLSACQSATDEGQASSERMGLAGAFLEAGARTVIATLWPIEDKTARGFMAAFYRELVITKEDPCTALQEVQRKIIRGNRLSGSPTKDIQAWAPYLVIGPL
ncbi:MAG TPA: CHAT domain-containing protein, partial [Candidatus Bathyarchaeia archaeon]|nr:CHAT domain-containing protein [Candidatus Bathyarchaeia archaeon]